MLLQGLIRGGDFAAVWGSGRGRGGHLDRFFSAGFQRIGSDFHILALTGSTIAACGLARFIDAIRKLGGLLTGAIFVDVLLEHLFGGCLGRI